MPFFPQYDYIFGLGLVFAFADAFGIGANDVANSFATSVSSRSLTLAQACIAAAVMEFLGAVLAGSRVADTIRSKIIDVKIFQDDPAVLMLGMLCALMASSTWLIFCTKIGFSVSTTHSIVGAVIGIGIAARGADVVNWGWTGVGGILASWLIAPAIAGCIASIAYLLSKYLVLERKSNTMNAIYMGPVAFFVTSGVCTMSIVWKGAPNLKLDKLSTPVIIGAIFGTAAVVAILSILFWVPFVYARVVKGDYTLRWYHFFLGPALWTRTPPADASEFTAAQAVPDYYKGHRTHEEQAALDARTAAANRGEVSSSNGLDAEKGSQSDTQPTRESPADARLKAVDDSHTIVGPFILPRNLFIIFRYKAGPFIKRGLLRGVTQDVVGAQVARSEAEAERIKEIHSRAKQYPNKTEHAFSFLQVLTACTMSFAHGSNDVSNAIGPLATIYQVWSTGSSNSSKNPVPVWILVFGASAIVIGLATYGYHMMALLGNRIILHSPSRGFAMEFGAACTVVLATRLSIPLSTTQTITGATLGVGLCNGDWRAINYRVLAWLMFGWCLTLPVVGLASGCLFAFVTQAPRFGYAQ
ncbi:phosphate transporter [Mycena crocata]|nr:phosphate transporter [Mycena crocata]